MDLQAAKHHPGAPSFLAIGNPRSQIYAEAPLRRTGDPFLIDCEASISIHQTRYFAISGGSLKNRSRSAGAGTSPRKALRRKRFLTP